MKTSSFALIAISLLGVVVGATITPIIALLVSEGITTEIIAFYRLFFISLFLVPAVFGQKENRKICANASGYQWVLMLSYSLTKAFTLLLWTEAIRAGGTPFITTTLGNMALVFVVALSYLFYGEKLSLKGMVGIGVCIVGIGIVATADISTGIGNCTPIFCILFASAFSAANSLLARAAGKVLPIIPLITMGYLISTLITWLVAVLRQGSFALSPYSLFLLFILGCFSTLLSHSIPIWAVQYLSPTTVQVIGLPAPFFTAIISYFLFKETPSLYTLAGSLVIIAGLFYYLYSFTPRQKE